MSAILGLILIALAMGPAVAGVDRTVPAATARPIFEDEIQPILAKHCLNCHKAPNPKGGLDLGSLSGLLRGGESGEPGIVPGQVAASKLRQVIEDGDMPPRGRPRLNAAERSRIDGWIGAGAQGRAGADPGGDAGKSGKDASMRDQLALQVFDLLDYKCLMCHGSTRREAGLDLSTRAAALRGGKSGPALVSGRSSESLLIRTIRGDKMPPRLARYELSIKPVIEPETALLARWIDEGAPDFPRRPILGPSPGSVSRADRAWWAFRSPIRPTVPNVRHAQSIRTPVDAFLLSRLEQAGLAYSEEANPQTLIRRLYLDLIGLPPTPDEIRTFLADLSPDRYERVVDRLLANPRYGERWGQHWLDAAGFSESDGGDDGDPIRPEFFRYRDYVIRALNSDKPYDRFLIEQLAGDEIVDHTKAGGLTSEDLDSLVATGFLRTCVDPTDRPVHNFLNDRYQVLADTVNVVGSTLMGLTIGCARCHSHKYDPISITEYYQLSAVFAAAYYPMNWKLPRERKVPLVPPAERAAIEARGQAVDRLSEPFKGELAGLTASYRARRLEQKLVRVPEPDRSALRTALAQAPEKRSAAQTALVDRLGSLVEVKDEELPAAFPEYRPISEWLQGQAATLESIRPIVPTARAITDVSPGSAPFYVQRRGEPHQRGDEVLPAVPDVLTDGTPAGGLEARPRQLVGGTTGRRLAFARWLTRKDNPLTARVLVNRVWQHHFGSGLVTTPDNFGRTGARPTHPELLDWLAVELAESDWSLKRLHRLIVTSRAYRQSSRRRPEAMAVDPENTLWWRMPLRRMDAESIRDSILEVAGTLDGRMHGPAAEIVADEEGQVDARPTGGLARRSVYVVHQRSKPLTILDVFDAPRMTINCVQRRTSTVAPQALTLLNSPWSARQAEALAHRLIGDLGPRRDLIIDRAIWRIFGRSARDGEPARLTAFLRDREVEYSRQGGLERGDRLGALERAAADLCLVLFNAPEFLYVD